MAAHALAAALSPSYHVIIEHIPAGRRRLHSETTASLGADRRADLRGMAVLQVPSATMLLGLMAFVLAFYSGPWDAGLKGGLRADRADAWVAPRTHRPGIFRRGACHRGRRGRAAHRRAGRAVGLHPVVSIVALIAGAELFGLRGALFAAPVAGVVQAVIVDFWRGWRAAHSSEFAADTPREVMDNAGIPGAGGDGAPVNAGWAPPEELRRASFPRARRSAQMLCHVIRHCMAQARADVMTTNRLVGRVTRSHDSTRSPALDGHAPRCDATK